MNIKDFRYVYNKQQAEFYMFEYYIVPEKIDDNPRTGKKYYKFKDSILLQSAYRAWMERKYGKN
jgi:hypothetical protein